MRHRGPEEAAQGKAPPEWGAVAAKPNLALWEPSNHANMGKVAAINYVLVLTITVVYQERGTDDGGWRSDRL